MHKKRTWKKMDGNTGMPMEKIRKLLDKSKVDYDIEKVNDFEILKSGVIASVVSVPMKDGSVKVIKIVDKSQEIPFLSDISIFKKFSGLIARFKPKALGYGSRKVIMGYMETIKNEFDLRYEAKNIIIQKGVTERLNQETNVFNITDSSDCLCDAINHGRKEKYCQHYCAVEGLFFELHNVSKKCFSDIEFKTQQIDLTLSTRDMLVMEKINGVVLDNNGEKTKAMLVTKLGLSENINDVTERVQSDCSKLIEGFSLCGLLNEGYFRSSADYNNTMIAVEDGKWVLYQLGCGGDVYASIDRASTIAFFSLALIEAKVSDRENKSDKQLQHMKVIKKCLLYLGAPERKGMDIDWGAIEKDIISTVESGDCLSIFNIAFDHGLVMHPPIIRLINN